MLLCKFCGKECKNANSHKNHERLCKENPHRVYKNGMVGKKGGNQFTKAKELGLPPPKLSTESIAKGLQTKKQNNTLCHTEESKKRISDAMKLAVLKHPESYTQSNRGRVKLIEYDGVKFHGNWELLFYKWCKSNSIKIIRNDLWFDYIWNGKRKYNPDFYLLDYDCYIEVKGYKTDRDDAKWSSFPKTLKVISKKEIEKIKRNEFTL